MDRARGIVFENSPFVLAAARTQRKDPLDGLRYYTGGWNISSEHYWSVSSRPEYS